MASDMNLRRDIRELLTNFLLLNPKLNLRYVMNKLELACSYTLNYSLWRHKQLLFVQQLTGSCVLCSVSIGGEDHVRRFTSVRISGCREL